MNEFLIFAAETGTRIGAAHFNHVLIMTIKSYAHIFHAVCRSNFFFFSFVVYK